MPAAPLLANAPPAAAGRALQLLRATFGDSPLSVRVGSGRDLARAHREQEREPFPTALPALDRLLAGGLPRGELVELVGGRSSGRFSAVLALLAGVTAAGEAAGLVDLGDHFDPAAAAGMGVDLPRLLWLRPASLKQALAGAEMLLGCGFPLVVVELGFPPLAGGRGAEGAWLRLARAAHDQGAALLVASPYRVSGTAAAAVLEAGGQRTAWQGGGATPRLLTGLASHLAVEKRRGALAGRSEPLELTASPLPPAPPPPPLRWVADPGAPKTAEWPALRLAAGG